MQVLHHIDMVHRIVTSGLRVGGPSYVDLGVRGGWIFSKIWLTKVILIQATNYIWSVYGSASMNYFKKNLMVLPIVGIVTIFVIVAITQYMAYQMFYTYGNCTKGGLQTII